MWQEKGFTKKSLDPKQVVGTMREVDKDFHYWFADTLVKNKGPVIERIKRKLRLA